MKSDVLSKFTQIWLPSSALIIFVTIFIVMLVYILKKTSLQRFDVISKLPFEEGTKDER